MRIRVTFSKQGALRYTGHLDLHKILERSIRRAELPLAYSQGYHPQPKLNLAAALPLGFASRAEVMDIWLNEDVEDVVSPLQANVPPGLTIVEASQVDEREPSLQSQVVAAEYKVELTEDGSSPEPARPGRSQTVPHPVPHPVPQAGSLREAGFLREAGSLRERAGDEGRLLKHLGPSTSSGPALDERIASLLAYDSLPRERRGKKYDLRPLIEELTLTPDPLSSPKAVSGRRARGPDGGALLKGEGNRSLFMRLTAREGATGRPEEVLDELGIPLEDTRIERIKLIFKDRQNGR